MKIFLDTSELLDCLERLERADEFKRNFITRAKAIIAAALIGNAPKGKTRLLAGSVVCEDTEAGFIVYSKAPYALFVERGTGLFGPYKRRIYPTTKKALRFEINGRVVFARWVRGQKGQWFFQRTAEETAPIIRVLATNMMVEHFVV